MNYIKGDTYYCVVTNNDGSPATVKEAIYKWEDFADLVFVATTGENLRYDMPHLFAFPTLLEAEARRDILNGV